MSKRKTNIATTPIIEQTNDNEQEPQLDTEHQSEPKAKVKAKAKPKAKPKAKAGAKVEVEPKTKAKAKAKAGAKTKEKQIILSNDSDEEFDEESKTTHNETAYKKQNGVASDIVGVAASTKLYETDAQESKKKRTIIQVSQKEHVKMRSMWSGSKENQTLEMYVLDKDEDECLIFTPRDLFYPPALLKIIDEIIVNAIDHSVVFPKSVKDININITKDGVVSVWNNGPGIELKREISKIDGKEYWTPEMIFTQFLTGSNFRDDETTTGGQNGIGAKLAVIYSEFFTVETVDAESKKLYRQTYRNGMDIIEEPIIEDSRSKPYTSIIFLPDYKFLKIEFIKFYDTLYQLVETRAWQAAAFTTANVSFNGIVIPLKDFEQFCGMFPTNGVTMYKFESEKNPKFPWQVGLGISNGKEFNVSLINGIFVSKGGTHIQHIQNKIVTNVKTKLEKLLKETKQKFNKNILLNNISISLKVLLLMQNFTDKLKNLSQMPLKILLIMICQWLIGIRFGNQFLNFYKMNL